MKTDKGSSPASNAWQGLQGSESSTDPAGTPQDPSVWVPVGARSAPGQTKRFTATAENLRRYHSHLEEILKGNFFAVLSIGNTVTLVCLLFVQVLLVFWIAKLQRMPPPTLVLDASGSAHRAYPVAHNYRTEERIHAFVQDTLTLMFTWKYTVVDPKTGTEIPDEGVMLVRDGRLHGNKVPTTVYLASQAFSLDMQKPILQRVSELVPQEVFRGEASSAFVLSHISNPVRVGDEESGEYYVDVVGHISISNETDTTKNNILKFNKRIFVRAVPEVYHPIPDEQPALHEAIENIRLGLEITAIKDLPLS